MKWGKCCDGLASHPGREGGVVNNTPSLCMLGMLCWTSITSRGSSNTSSCFIAGYPVMD